MKMTRHERRIALLHATAHEATGHALMEQMTGSTSYSQDVMLPLARAILTLGGEYRRIANSGEMAE